MQPRPTDDTVKGPSLRWRWIDRMARRPVGVLAGRGCFGPGRRHAAEFPSLEIAHRGFDLLPRVHDEGPIADYWLGNRRAAEQQQTAVGGGLHAQPTPRASEGAQFWR